MSKNKWVKIDEEVVYDNPWISVTHENVITPTGTKGIYGKVHFKNTAVAIVPIDKAGNTWLVGQHRYPSNIYSWEIPEGGALIPEEPLVGAKRELREETGIIANKWTEIHHFYTSNSVTDEHAIIYVAQELTFTETEMEDTEDLVIKKLPLKEAIQMAFDNEITDSLACIALMKIDYLIRKGKIEI